MQNSSSIYCVQKGLVYLLSEWPQLPRTDVNVLDDVGGRVLHLLHAVPVLLDCFLHKGVASADFWPGLPPVAMPLDLAPFQIAASPQSP